VGSELLFEPAHDPEKLQTFRNAAPRCFTELATLPSQDQLIALETLDLKGSHVTMLPPLAQQQLPGLRTPRLI
jgi:hypothetical protein